MHDVNSDGPRSGQHRHRRARWRFTTPAVLLLLRNEPAHGYDLLERLPGIFPRAVDPPDPGTFYRLLRSMEDDGAIASSWDTTTQAGPARRVYALTDAGREQLDWWGLQIERDADALHRFLAALADSRSSSPTSSPSPSPAGTAPTPDTRPPADHHP